MYSHRGKQEHLLKHEYLQTIEHTSSVQYGRRFSVFPGQAQISGEDRISQNSNKAARELGAPLIRDFRRRSVVSCGSQAEQNQHVRKSIVSLFFFSVQKRANGFNLCKQ
ncbi:unnamed protein product [Ixodes persulcatus]